MKAADTEAYLDAVFQEAAARHRSGDAVGAFTLYAAVLQVVPDSGLVMHLAGAALRQTGRAPEALTWLSRAEALSGDDPLLQHELGEAAWRAGARARALRAFDRALRRKPDLLDSRIARSLLLRELGAFADASREARIAVALVPEDARSHVALGVIGEASHPFARATMLQPLDAGAWVNLGAMLLRDTIFGPAVRATRRALALSPALGGGWSNFGSIMLALCRPAYAATCQRRGLALEPSPELHSNVLFSMLSDPAVDAAAEHAEARRWAARYGAPRRTASLRRSGATPGRLTVGYVSSDFRRHPVAGNVIELIERRDRQRFSVNCYAEVYRPDAVTERFRVAADRWIPTVGLRDDEVLQIMRADCVDVLVFLGGHTASNRLTLAAAAAAPVSVSFHAPCTTGLSSIDYWLSDERLTPAGSQRHFSERLHLLPSFYTFEALPTDASPAAGRLRRGPVFGSFNNPGKLNDQVLSAWHRILQAAPQARLRLGYHRHFEDPTLRRRIREALPVEPARLEFMPAEAGGPAHLRRLADVDVILDTFPFGGATSTYEALWMGTPVVTIEGERFVSRVGAALLRELGLPELVASGVDDYVQRAVASVGDTSKLAELRAGLRERLFRSPYLDHAGQTRALEAALQAMWARKREEGR